MRCDARIREISRIHTCHMMHSYVCHDEVICVTWPLDTCDITFSRERIPPDSRVTFSVYDLLYVTWPPRYVSHDPFIRSTWLFHIFNMTHFHRRIPHDKLSVYDHVCVTWPLDICHVTPWFVWHDSLMCVTWLIFTGDLYATTESPCLCITVYVRLDPFISVT